MSDERVIKCKPDQWLEVKWQGTVYYVCVSSLLAAWSALCATEADEND